ncbi:MAG: CatB-related O-acetyltransferase [Maritimibacter sp.]
MAVPFLDADARHPLQLPDGSIFEQTVWLKNVIDHPNIEVGDYTYYNDFDPVEDYASRIAPYLHPGAPERLIIGRFCQLAHGARFITSSADHPKRWFTTYPFAVFDHEQMPYFAEEFAKGRDTVIGHDVWIGHEARVMPGVSIGNGVIIGTGAVVTRDVPDWSVVVGNPARVVRRRFAPSVCEKLDQLAWWHRDVEEIRALVPVLASQDEAALDRALAAFSL